MEAEPRLLELGSLLRHIAIVDSPGIGSKMAFALNLIEQALERDVAVVVLDRTGDLCGYANPSWWQRTADTTRARGLAERIDVRLFTPGIRGGRPLSLAVIPDLTQVSAAEREPAVHDAAGALAAMMQLDGRADKAALLAVLTKAIAALAAHLAPCGLGELIALVESRDETLAGCDEQLRRRLIADLALLLGNADVFAPGAELLTVETLIGRSVGGKVPLAIASTRFLGDAARVQTWVTQLIACLNSHVATARNSTPRVVVLFDGAELLLPTGAAKSPSTEPLQDLLRGAQAAGVGVMLASQNPAGFDYRPCGLINTWFLGRTEERSVEKMKPLFEHRPLGHKNLSRLESGRFVMLRDEGPAAELDRGSSLLRPDPLAEAELMALAARTMPRSQDVAQSRKPGSDERLGAVPR
jgi:hypothetical protein